MSIRVQRRWSGNLRSGLPAVGAGAFAGTAIRAVSLITAAAVTNGCLSYNSLISKEDVTAV